jgi:hypothetical protein
VSVRSFFRQLFPGRSKAHRGSADATRARRLTEVEYKATFGEPMRRVASNEGPAFDFWPYFEAIPEEDFEGFDCSAGRVSMVVEHPDRSYQHVLVDSEARDVFMVVVLDLGAKLVIGHRLLDLPRDYGLRD